MAAETAAAAMEAAARVAAARVAAARGAARAAARVAARAAAARAVAAFYPAMQRNASYRRLNVDDFQLRSLWAVTSCVATRSAMECKRVGCHH